MTSIAFGSINVNSFLVIRKLNYCVTYIWDPLDVKIFKEFPQFPHVPSPFISANQSLHPRR